MKSAQIQKLANQIWYLPPEEETDRPILAAVCGEQHTLLIDAGNSPAHARLFLNELDSKQVTNIHLAVLTHWHWDHTFGASQIHIPKIAHTETRKKLETLVHLSWSDEELDKRVKEGNEILFCAEMIKKEYGAEREISIISPEITFEEKLEINLGGIHCVIEHVAGDHAADSSVIWVEEEKVLFLGDCLYPDLYAKLPSYTVDKMTKLLDKLELFDAETYVLSHEQPMSRDEFLGYVQLLRMLCQMTENHQGDQAKMISAFNEQLGREPVEIELEAIQCFANGTI